MTNSANPDQLASSEATDLALYSSQSQGISGLSRTRNKITLQASKGVRLILNKTKINPSINSIHPGMQEIVL